MLFLIITGKIIATAPVIHRTPHHLLTILKELQQHYGDASLCLDGTIPINI